MQKIILRDIEKNEFVKKYLKQADENFSVIGYKEHGIRHAKLVGHISYNVLSFLKYPTRYCEIASIAGFLHDIGNCMGAEGHEMAGALLSIQLLRDMGMNLKEITKVAEAIGTHEERTYSPANPITASVVLGDKTDVHYTRVRKKDPIAFDVHDRVNYACQNAFLKVDKNSKTIALELIIDTKISTVMEYFEIFLSRTLVCQKAAKSLGCKFIIYINDTRFL